jgi:hypothetical protein
MAQEGRATDRRASHGSEGGWSHQDRGNIEGEFGQRHRERRRADGIEQGWDEGELHDFDRRGAGHQRDDPRHLNEPPSEHSDSTRRGQRPSDSACDRRHAQGFAGKGPRNYQRSDARILEDVCDRLTDAPDVDASGISVHVENGEIRLEGTVPSRFTKRRAEAIADAVPGVRDVHNQLRVVGSHGSSGGEGIVPDPSRRDEREPTPNQ